MSVFFVTVPTREFEVSLRQKELDLQNVQYEERRASVLSMSGENIRTNSHDSNISIHAPDHYKAVHAGKQTEVIVSDDYMEIREVQVRKDSTETEDQQIEAEIRKYYLEKHLEDTLEKYDLNACTTWSVSYGGKMSQVTFSVPLDVSDVIIQRLHSVGVGVKYHSSITVCSANVYYGPKKDLDRPKETGNEGMEEENAENETKQSSWSEFVKSIKSRLTVAQVVSQVQANAAITFDFLALVFVAATIACLGLLEDSSVVIVASMLVSPLMGPIMAFTFGSTIRDCKLIRIGIKSEFAGLAICLVVGLVSGILLISLAEVAAGPWSKAEKWPTYEMANRGKPHGSIVGCLMAVPSGVGVALSILAGNAGSLVGVAIAASLLPPAVNCGLFWGMSMVIAIQRASNGKGWSNSCQDYITKNASNPLSEPYHFVKHTPVFCNNSIWEFVILGTVSFGLTWINIIIIFCVALAILKLKEVAPYTTKESLKRFWQEDLAYTRNYNMKHQNEDINAGIMDDINSAENPEAVRAKLEQDQTFAQINRRVGGGVVTGAAILSDYRKGINNVTGSEIQLPRLKRRLSHIPMREQEQQAKDKDGTWFGGWFSKNENAGRTSVVKQQTAGAASSEEDKT